jgi:hypothetical protein
LVFKEAYGSAGVKELRYFVTPDREVEKDDNGPQCDVEFMS